MNNWHGTGILCARDRRGSAIRTSQSGRGASATWTAAGVEPPEGALASPVERPHKTKNKSKRSQSTGTDTCKLPYRDNTHSSEVVRIFTAMFIRVLQGTMPYIVWAEQNTHLLYCVCTCEQRNIERCCEFVMTASWSISKGMGMHREL